MRQGITLGERQAGDTACLTVRSGAVLWPHPRPRPRPSPPPQTRRQTVTAKSPFAQSS